MDRCDVIDMLEEAALAHREMDLVLRSGKRFYARVLDVVTRAHEDYAILDDGRSLSVTEIAECRRTEPPLNDSYDLKL